MELDALDQKLSDALPGRIVRKDLVQQMKSGFNVPIYVWSISWVSTAPLPILRSSRRAWSTSARPSAATTSAPTRVLAERVCDGSDTDRATLFL